MAVSLSHTTNGESKVLLVNKNNHSDLIPNFSASTVANNTSSSSSDLLLCKIMMSDSEPDQDESGKTSEKAGEYVRELLLEKQSLDSSQWPNALRLLDQEVTKEVARVQSSGKPLPKESKYVDIYREKPIRVAVKVLVPIKEHPKFNFVGKLLGPKGNSMKRLQEDTMTKMAVLGRGSMKDKQKEEDLRASLDPKYAHLSDDLHVEIAAFAPPAEAHARIAYALAEVRKYLIPDSNDEIRQEQMREMEMIQTVTSDSPTGANGTQPSLVRKPMYAPMPGRGMMVNSGRFRWPSPGMSSVSASAGRASPMYPTSLARGGARGAARLPTRLPAQLRSGLLAPPPAQRGRKPPPPALLPRPTASKTKVLSILDRARVAMEESYGYEEELAGGGAAGGFYEAQPYDSYTTTGYSGGYDDFEDSAVEYYDSSDAYPEEAGNRWKGGFKPTVGLRAERAQYRTSPYTRPAK